MTCVTMAVTGSLVPSAPVLTSSEVMVTSSSQFLPERRQGALGDLGQVFSRASSEASVHNHGGGPIYRPLISAFSWLIVPLCY